MYAIRLCATGQTLKHKINDWDEIECSVIELGIPITLRTYMIEINTKENKLFSKQ